MGRDSRFKRQLTEVVEERAEDFEITLDQALSVIEEQGGEITKVRRLSKDNGVQYAVVHYTWEPPAICADL
ncbi:hypothetical protein HGI30_15955 [Paenibacillus albicereus]|uniref:Uncharacterized protein n=1 Tax=Paenibacillus albicereus TaxID=2726185 RepID=A0A6H2GZQ1_9BACL|nr:hypothetical protein [Paenibacillus albicereus]QJC52914.1 hypothetical protein HGI30_15955 [Paenibacillus albicereus]